MNRVALDTNVLVMVFREEGAPGSALRTVLANHSAAGTRFAIPVFCLGEFWRVATDRRARAPVPPVRALAWTDWLLSHGATLLTPGPAYWPILKTQLAATLPVGTDVFDSQIAALCQEHGIAEIWTFDRAFVPHSQLRAVNPLALPEARRLLM
jgi:predicted nucleic acid-binding protein